MNLYAAWVSVALMKSCCEGYYEIYCKNAVESEGHNAVESDTESAIESVLLVLVKVS